MPFTIMFNTAVSMMKAMRKCEINASNLGKSMIKELSDWLASPEEWYASPASPASPASSKGVTREFAEGGWGQGQAVPYEHKSDGCTDKKIQ